MVFLQSASVKLNYPYDLWFLRPSDPEAGPTQDTVVSGEVLLTLPWPKRVKRIDVELVGRQSAHIAGRYEQNETLRREITLNPCESGDKLEPGEHRFAWSFIIPANTAPYERSHVGMTKHHLRAKVYGVGPFKGDLEDNAVLCCVANNNIPGQAAAGLNATSESVHPVFGPMRVHLFSKYLLISGFLRLAITLPVVNDDVEIKNMSLILTQHHALKSMNDPSLTDWRDEVHTLWDLQSGAPLFGYRGGKDVVKDRPKNKGQLHGWGYPTTSLFTEIDAASSPVTVPINLPLRLGAGQEFALVRQVRLPNDDTIRQSTSPWSTTGIRISHTASIVIRYTTDADGTSTPGGNKDRDKAVKELKVNFDLTISSCDCSMEVLILPNYDQATDPTFMPSATLNGWRTKSPRDCLCTISAREAEAVEARYAVGKDGLMSLDEEDRWGHESRSRERNERDRERWKEQHRSESGSRPRTPASTTSR